MMIPVRVYLDACVVARLFDDRSQLRVRQEAEGVEALLQMFAEERAVWVTSDALPDELLENPDKGRKDAGVRLLSLSGEKVAIDDATEQRARELEGAGYGAYDALHLACAEQAQVDLLLTTDDRFEKRAARGLGMPRVPVQNPLNFLSGAPQEKM
jgi:predicted nucleic acid-binding protein